MSPSSNSKGFSATSTCTTTEQLVRCVEQQLKDLSVTAKPDQTVKKRSNGTRHSKTSKSSETKKLNTIDLSTVPFYLLEGRQHEVTQRMIKAQTNKPKRSSRTKRSRHTCPSRPFGDYLHAHDDTLHQDDVIPEEEDNPWYKRVFYPRVTRNRVLHIHVNPVVRPHLYPPATPSDYLLPVPRRYTVNGVPHPYLWVIHPGNTPTTMYTQKRLSHLPRYPLPSSNGRVDPILTTKIPPEIILRIMSYLDSVSSTTFGLTCHKYYDIHRFNHGTVPLSLTVSGHDGGGIRTVYDHLGDLLSSWMGPHYHFCPHTPHRLSKLWDLRKVSCHDLCLHFDGYHRLARKAGDAEEELGNEAWERAKRSTTYQSHKAGKCVGDFCWVEKWLGVMREDPVEEDEYISPEMRWRNMGMNCDFS